MKIVMIVLSVAAAVIAATLILIYAGVFNVAADEPHAAPVYTVLAIIRDRSIAVRARDVQVPGLEDPKSIATGAQHYAAMCEDCHLAPDKRESELRDDLYPQPPDLTKPNDSTPAEMFWIIKHGLKMSGMPAWGRTHDDASIWALVAFVQKLPGYSPAQYQVLSHTVEGGRHPHSHAQHEHPGAASDTSHAEPPHGHGQ